MNGRRQRGARSGTDGGGTHRHDGDPRETPPHARINARPAAGTDCLNTTNAVYEGKPMISDVLSEACHQIREYLEDPVYNDMYSGKLRDEIERIVSEMDRLRAKLDQPPAHAEQRQ
jgi:hypothetical protein